MGSMLNKYINTKAQFCCGGITLQSGQRCPVCGENVGENGINEPTKEIHKAESKGPGVNGSS